MSAVHFDRDGRARCGRPNVTLSADREQVTCATCRNIIDGTHGIGNRKSEALHGTLAAARRHYRRGERNLRYRCPSCWQAEQRASEDKWQDDDWREAYNARRREQYAAALAAGASPREAQRRKDQRRAA
jgi:hypothetical protein